MSNLLMSHVDVGGGEVYQVTAVDRQVNEARLTDPSNGRQHTVELDELEADIESGTVQKVTPTFVAENEVVVRRLPLAEVIDYVGSDAELYDLEENVQDAHAELTGELDDD